MAAKKSGTKKRRRPGAGSSRKAKIVPKKKRAASKKKAPKKRAAAKKRKDPNRQTGSSIKFFDEAVRAKAPGKRKSASGSTYYERRRNRSDKPGSLSGFKQVALGKLGAALLKYERATTIKATKAAQKEKVKWRRVLKSIEK